MQQTQVILAVYVSSQPDETQTPGPGAESVYSEEEAAQ
jgi:hypothetical protein